MSFFWLGHTLEDFIFQHFNIHSYQAFFAICLGLFSLAILYEGILVLKRTILSSFVESKPRPYIQKGRRPGSSQIRNEAGGAGEPHEELLASSSYQDNVTSLNGNRNQSRTRQCANYSRLATSSVLHGIYVFIGFTLMNAVMTYNVWVLIVVSLGMGFGYFLFGNARRYDFLMESVTIPAPICVSSEGGADGERLVMSNNDERDS